MQNKLYQLQKKIYDTTKRKALSYEGERSFEMRRYQKDQRFFSKRKFRVAKAEEILDKVEQSQIIYLGDFHTFDQSSRNLERILRVLIELPKQFVLGMEMIHRDHQIYVDAYCAGEITELELLECINYHSSWRFPWNHYKHFFHSAKQHGFSIIGLNSSGGLKQRDENCAETLVEIIQDDPNKKLLVLFGELHIVPNKIPRLVDQAAKQAGLKSVKQLIIHQNIDEIYWKLKQHSSIVRFGPNEYSIQSSPPWMKYESMIYWYENLCEDPDFDIHEYIIEKGFKLLGGQAQDQFYQICNQVHEALGRPPVASDEYQDFSLYDHKDLQKLTKNLMNEKRSSIRSFISDALTRNKLVKVDSAFHYYCSSYSINRLAYLVGQYLFHKDLEAHGEHFFSILMQGDRGTKLALFVQQSICGYLSSKIINPYRKCDLYQDLLDQSKSSIKRQAHLAAACLQVLQGKANLEQLFRGKKSLYYLEAGEKIGHMLGDILFEKYRANPTQVHLNALFQYHGLNSSHLQQMIQSTLEGVDYRQGKKRYF